MTTGTASLTPLGLALGQPGTVLVEASAGTGKTHALTTLVARLVVEEGREVDEILVVTFTRAATAELRERIRRTLKGARDALRAEMEQRIFESEPQARELVEHWAGAAGADLEVSARRLDAALQDIDRASVHTIHGFCQRVLGDLAFEGGFPFGFEVSADDEELTLGAVRDFWRRRLYDASLVLVRYAVENEFLPGALARWIAAGRTKAGLRIAGADAPTRPLEAQETEWRQVFEDTRTRWEEHGETFRREMCEGTWLNRGRYRQPRLSRQLDFVESSFASPEPRLWEEDVASWIGRERVSGACRKNASLPENPLFDAFDRLEEASRPLRTAFDAWLRWARGELITELRAAARRRVREERRLRYDDLLVEVEAALGNPGGARLAESIRRAHPCALIDEFQDTDQVQARIFARVYADAGRAGRGEHADPASLFVVGDPKQSIYRFRGADIFAYLDIRRRADPVLALDRNWRSVPGIIAAVNEVFAAPLPFALPEIEYRPVAKAGGDEVGGQPERDEDGPPFALRLLPQGPLDKAWNKGDANRVATEAAASEVAALLEPGTGDARERAASRDAPQKRAWRGSDIAVLVRTRRQGRLIAKALHERGVRAAEVSDENVFDTREAEQLERLLRCLAEPLPESEERGALAGDLFALDSVDLLSMEEDDDVWSEWRERLQAWRRSWKTQGVGALLLHLLEDEGGAERLLRRPDGARRLTNYRHLAELLLEAESEGRTSPSGLAGWLGRRRRAGTREREESGLLRLDSDEQLVRIVTVHGSKGLEFPVVFCPFAWDVPDPGRGGSDADVAYHERAGEEYREVLDLAPDDAARGAARVEEFSESLRLLYVALTRAKHRCIVTWGRVKGAQHSPLAWLLHRGPEVRAGTADTGSGPGHGKETDPRSQEVLESPPVVEQRQTWDAPGHSSREPLGESTEFAASHDLADALDAVAQRFEGLAWSEWRDEIQAYAERCDGAVSARVLDPDETRSVPPQSHPSPILEARVPGRPLRRVRQMTSFSALSAGGAHATGAGAHALTERPDHDAGETPALRAEEQGEGAPAGDGDVRNAFTFPRGAAAGSCLHRAFERLDRAPPEDAAPELDAVCHDALHDFGFEEAWQPVLRAMIERTRAVRLCEPGPSDGAGFRLAESVARIAEMEFHFPVTDLVRGRLAECLEAHDYPHPLGNEAGHGGAGVRAPIDGYLRGFVDLTVVHEGRWYIIDYKSNWLGANPAHYAPAALRRATFASGYPLQYLIYVVALHRHLEVRLPGYDYDLHMGGVFYLYVRGIDPAAGMSRGVYFDRPPRACIQMLDDCFRGTAPVIG